MKKTQDAFGQFLMAALNGEEAHEIVERDDGYVAASTYTDVYLADFRDWPIHNRRAMGYVRGRVLDVGIGAGRFALHLQKKKHDVLGIDVSPLSLKVCQLRGVKNLLKRDIRDLGKFKDNEFDTIIMMGNNFGLFGSPQRAKRLLATMRRITSGKGRLVVESRDPYKTKDPDHLAYHRFNKQRGRMPGQLRLRILFKKARGDWFDYLFVSKKEMKQLLKGSGWKARKFIDGKNGSYVAVIDKK